MGHRLEGIPGFGIDRVAAAAGADPDVLRLENLDTDVPPHPDAVEVTRAAVGRDEANSYLPFSGLDEMKEAVAGLIRRRGGPEYDPYAEIVITQGEGDNMLNALLALTDPGDEVILTDPTYAGMLQRVRLVGAVPRLVPLRGDPDGWRLDLDALQAAVSERTRVALRHEPVDAEWLGGERRGVGGHRGHLPRARRHAPLLDAHGGDRLRRAAGRRPVGVRGDARPHGDPRLGLDGAADDRLARRLDGRERRARADARARPHLQRRLRRRLRADGRRGGDRARRRRRPRGGRRMGASPRRGAAAVRGAAARPCARRLVGAPRRRGRRHRAPELSRRLLEQKVAATPMTAWGDTVAPRHVRFVFSNEPVERLALLGERLRAALG